MEEIQKIENTKIVRELSKNQKGHIIFDDQKEGEKNTAIKKKVEKIYEKI